MRKKINATIILAVLALAIIAIATTGEQVAAQETYTTYLPIVQNSCTNQSDPEIITYYQPTDIWWRTQENENSSYDWSRIQFFENKLESLRCDGIEPIIIIHDTPPWAAWYTGGCSPVGILHIEAYANFVAALVNRYN